MIRRHSPADRGPLAFSLERCSTGGQVGGDTYGRQRRHNVDWIGANSHLGLTLDETLDLRGAGSASKADVTAVLGRFIDALDCGRVRPGDYLLVEDVSRLTRRGELAAVELVARIVRSGVSVVTTASGTVYDDSHQGQIALHGLLAEARAAACYAEDLSRRASSSWRAETAAIVAGTRWPRRAPWWCVGGGKVPVTPHPDRWGDARRIVEMSLSGVGGTTLARRLNADGVPASMGGQWGTSSVNVFLRDGRLTGRYVTKDGTTVECLPRLASDAEFDRLRAGMRGRRKSDAHAPAENPGGGMWAGLIRDVRDGAGVRRLRQRARPGQPVRHLFQGGGALAGFTPSAPLDADWCEHCLLALLDLADPADLAGPDPEAAPLRDAVDTAREAVDTAAARLEVALEVYDADGTAAALRAAGKWEAALDAARADLERARAARDARPGAAGVAEARTVLGLLREAGGTDRERALRRRLGGLIRETVDRIDLRPVRVRGWRVGLFTVVPRRGDHRMNVLALTRVGSKLKVPVRRGLVWRSAAPGVAHDPGVPALFAPLAERIVDPAEALRAAVVACRRATRGAGYLEILEGQQPDPVFVAAVAMLED